MLAECNFSKIDAKYVLTIGVTAELMTVVDARRYSRNSGTISDDRDNFTSVSYTHLTLPTTPYV